MKTWIVVADASRARVILTVDRAKNFSVEHELEHPESRLRNQELVSDQSGRLDKGGRGILSAMDPATDAHEDEAKRFAAELAKLLEKGLSQKSFESLTLIAPAHFLGLLKGALSVQAGKKMRSAVAKDLTRMPVNELKGHLQQIIEQEPAFAG